MLPDCPYYLCKFRVDLVAVLATEKQYESPFFRYSFPGAALTSTDSVENWPNVSISDISSSPSSPKGSSKGPSTSFTAKNGSQKPKAGGVSGASRENSVFRHSQEYDVKADIPFLMSLNENPDLAITMGCGKQFPYVCDFSIDLSTFFKCKDTVVSQGFGDVNVIPSLLSSSTVPVPTNRIATDSSALFTETDPSLAALKINSLPQSLCSAPLPLRALLIIISLVSSEEPLPRPPDSIVVPTPVKGEKKGLSSKPSMANVISVPLSKPIVPPVLLSPALYDYLSPLTVSIDKISGIPRSSSTSTCVIDVSNFLPSRGKSEVADRFVQLKSLLSFIPPHLSIELNFPSFIPRSFRSYGLHTSDTTFLLGLLPLAKAQELIKNVALPARIVVAKSVVLPSATPALVSVDSPINASKKGVDKRNADVLLNGSGKDSKETNSTDYNGIYNNYMSSSFRSLLPIDWIYPLPSAASVALLYNCDIPASVSALIPSLTGYFAFLDTYTSYLGLLGSPVSSPERSTCACEAPSSVALEGTVRLDIVPEVADGFGTNIVPSLQLKSNVITDHEKKGMMRSSSRYYQSTSVAPLFIPRSCALHKHNRVIISFSSNSSSSSITTDAPQAATTFRVKLTASISSSSAVINGNVLKIDGMSSTLKSVSESSPASAFERIVIRTRGKASAQQSEAILSFLDAHNLDAMSLHAKRTNITPVSLGCSVNPFIRSLYFFRVDEESARKRDLVSFFSGLHVVYNSKENRSDSSSLYEDSMEQLFLLDIPVCAGDSCDNSSSVTGNGNKKVPKSGSVRPVRGLFSLLHSLHHSHSLSYPSEPSSPNVLCNRNVVFSERLWSDIVGSLFQDTPIHAVVTEGVSKSLSDSSAESNQELMKGAEGPVISHVVLPLTPPPPHATRALQNTLHFINLLRAALPDDFAAALQAACFPSLDISLNKSNSNGSLFSLSRSSQKDGKGVRKDSSRTGGLVEALLEIGQLAGLQIAYNNAVPADVSATQLYGRLQASRNAVASITAALNTDLLKGNTFNLPDESTACLSYAPSVDGSIAGSKTPNKQQKQERRNTPVDSWNQSYLDALHYFENIRHNRDFFAENAAAAADASTAARYAKSSVLRNDSAYHRDFTQNMLKKWGFDTFDMGFFMDAAQAARTIGSVQNAEPFVDNFQELAFTLRPNLFGLETSRLSESVTESFIRTHSAAGTFATTFRPLGVSIEKGAVVGERGTQSKFVTTGTIHKSSFLKSGTLGSPDKGSMVHPALKPSNQRLEELYDDWIDPMDVSAKSDSEFFKSKYDSVKLYVPASFSNTRRTDSDGNPLREDNSGLVSAFHGLDVKEKLKPKKSFDNYSNPSPLRHTNLDGNFSSPGGKQGIALGRNVSDITLIGQQDRELKAQRQKDYELWKSKIVVDDVRFKV